MIKPIQKISNALSRNEISDESIFNLTSKWNTEEGETIQLEDLKTTINTNQN